MPLPIIPKALYPVVPFAPGVPPLLRDGAKILDGLTFGQLGIADALDSVLGTNSPRWGLFDEEGNAVITSVESVVSFEYANSARVSDYPIEAGKFSSYNKIADPFDITLVLTCGGDDSNRTDFISSIESASRSLNLYTVITPEVAYINANVVGQSYRRTSENGAHKITVELRITEVRQVAAAAFSNTKSDSAADPLSLGQIQPVDDLSYDLSDFA